MAKVTPILGKDEVFFGGDGFSSTATATATATASQMKSKSEYPTNKSIDGGKGFVGGGGAPSLASPWGMACLLQENPQPSSIATKTATATTATTAATTMADESQQPHPRPNSRSLIGDSVVYHEEEQQEDEAEERGMARNPQLSQSVASVASSVHSPSPSVVFQMDDTPPSSLPHNDAPINLSTLRLHSTHANKHEASATATEIIPSPPFGPIPVSSLPLTKPPNAPSPAPTNTEIIPSPFGPIPLPVSALRSTPLFLPPQQPPLGSTPPPLLPPLLLPPSQHHTTTSIAAARPMLVYSAIGSLERHTPPTTSLMGFYNHHNKTTTNQPFVPLPPPALFHSRGALIPPPTPKTQMSSLTHIINNANNSDALSAHDHTKIPTTPIKSSHQTNPFPQHQHQTTTNTAIPPTTIGNNSLATYSLSTITPSTTATQQTNSSSALFHANSQLGTPQPTTPTHPHASLMHTTTWNKTKTSALHHAGNRNNNHLALQPPPLNTVEPVEVFRPSCDAYTPRIPKRNTRTIPKRSDISSSSSTLQQQQQQQQHAAAILLSSTTSSMGTLSRPNFRDALRRVAMILQQHIVKIERRFQDQHQQQRQQRQRQQAEITKQDAKIAATANNNKNKVGGLFSSEIRQVFRERHYLTPRYKCTVVHLPLAAPAGNNTLLCGRRRIHNPPTIPTVEEIYNFAHVLFRTVHLSSECSIVCLIYVERLMEVAGAPLLADTWRPIFLCGLLLASKVWQDLSSWNVEFATVYPQYSLSAINALELQYLKLIKWDLYISSSLYAKYYFALRSLLEKKDFRQKYNRMVGGVGNVTVSEALKVQKRTERVKEEALAQLSRSM